MPPASELPLPATVDTSVWVSALINQNGPPARVVHAVAQDQIALVVAQAMLDELNDVLFSPRVRRRIVHSDEILDLLLYAIFRRAAIVNPTGTLHLSRDPADDVIIETALVGNARIIVSRDEDFTRDLRLIDRLHAAGVEVLTVAQFLTLLDHEAE